jgi:hypothetical protein
MWNKIAYFVDSNLHVVWRVDSESLDMSMGVDD